MRRVALAAFTVLSAGSCSESAQDTGGTPYTIPVPSDFPAVPVPQTNPLTVEKVTLGRWLFYDKRLSVNGTLACAGCHEQAKAFADGRVVSEGATGEFTPRNAPGLTNAAYAATLTWMNPDVDSLEEQHRGPMFGTAPIELGLTGHEDEVLARFRADPAMSARFEAAFPGEEWSMDRIVDAIASFVRTLVSGQSAFDRYSRDGQLDALSDSAKRGLDLFYSERAECFHCHSGFNFSGASSHGGGVLEGSWYFNIGLYDVDGNGAYPEPNTGLFAYTGEAKDQGRFRVPTLRNVALTGPYMHDGSLATLEDVVRFYEAGGRNVESGPNAGDGRANRWKSELVRGFQLSDTERADLIAFLESLTDEAFVSDPRFSDPFATPEGR